MKSIFALCISLTCIAANAGTLSVTNTSDNCVNRNHTYGEGNSSYHHHRSLKVDAPVVQPVVQPSQTVVNSVQEVMMIDKVPSFIKDAPNINKDIPGVRVDRSAKGKTFGDEGCDE